MQYELYIHCVHNFAKKANYLGIILDEKHRFAGQHKKEPQLSGNALRHHVKYKRIYWIERESKVLESNVC